jgi:broad specificity phosphatase PhoE
MSLASSKFLSHLRQSLSNLHSAGSRDSELTNHGYLQATRLGEHFKSSGVKFTHIFSSQLKRAVKSAQLVCDAQSASLVVKQVPLIMEQNFGFYEGKSIFARPEKVGTISGKDAHRALHKDDPEFVDTESKESMALRADTFLDDHLLPILEEEHVVAVVSHGIILSVLWRRLLQRLSAKSVTTRPEVVAVHGQLDLERLRGWSNTGYLELEMHPLAPRATQIPALASIDAVIETSQPEKEALPTAVLEPVVTVASSSLPEKEAPQEMAMSPPSKPVTTAPTTTKSFKEWTTTILAVNHKAHLTNLKRTRGGVGSSRHDEKQKSIHSFFKKQKKE